MAVTVLERSYQDDLVRFTVTLDGDDETVVVVRGKGSMPGAHAMLGYLDEAMARLSGARPARFFFDVTGVRGAPLRSQLMFGKWFYRHRKQVTRGVVVGAGPVERRLATAVCSIAGVRNVRFFERAEEARAWLAEIDAADQAAAGSRAG